MAVAWSTALVVIIVGYGAALVSVIQGVSSGVEVVGTVALVLGLLSVVHVGVVAPMVAHRLIEGSKRPSGSERGPRRVKLGWFLHETWRYLLLHIWVNFLMMTLLAYTMPNLLVLHTNDLGVVSGIWLVAVVVVEVLWMAASTRSILRTGPTPPPMGSS